MRGKRLNRTDSLKFRIMRDGDTNDPDIRQSLPVGPAVYGSYFSSSLVFLQVSGLSP